MVLAPESAPGEPARSSPAGIGRDERRVIVASSLGTVIEWYDFYLYGSLAGIIAKQFFSPLDETAQFIFALLAFAAGFAVRPVGAVLFGRLGDLAGRKYAFLVTIVVMGVSTTAVGLLPPYASIGIAAPILLVALRLAQGLALGGEYGGAATYVAEHAPPGRRGYFTSFVQTTATAGLVLSLLAVLACRAALGPRFDAWGWRIPFLLSLALLALSIYVRVRLQESPVFRRMKEEGQASRAPLTESFLRWGNARRILLVLLGATAGQAVVWYTGTFHAMFFLEHTLRIEDRAAHLMVAGALVLTAPFFLLFGHLSDRIGRKQIVLAGCLLAAATYRPIFRALAEYGNPAAFRAQAVAPIAVEADPAECRFQFDPVGKRRFASSCDIAKSWLANRSIPYANLPAPPGTIASVRIGTAAIVPSFDGRIVAAVDREAKLVELDRAMTDAIRAAGAGAYLDRADLGTVRRGPVLLLLFVLGLYVTMVYAPIAAWLVELFPARIRYTSTSLPYHVGNGWFGGFLPPIAFAMVAAKGDVLHGLWYPIAVALMTVVVGALFLPETKDREIHHGARP